MRKLHAQVERVKNVNLYMRYRPDYSANEASTGTSEHSDRYYWRKQDKYSCSTSATYFG